MAAPKKGSQKRMGLIVQPRDRHLRKDFPVDDKLLKLSRKKNFELENNSTNNEPISLEFITSIESVLKLRSKNDFFGIRDYAHIAKLILNRKPMLDSREEMLCLVFFEIGLSLGADHTLRGEIKHREPRTRGGYHSRFSRHEKDITELLKQYIANPVRHRQKLITDIEKIIGETLKKSTLQDWLYKLRNGQPLYKESLLTS